MRLLTRDGLLRWDFFLLWGGQYNNRISIVEPRSFVAVNGTIIAPFSSLLNNEWERRELC